MTQETLLQVTARLVERKFHATLEHPGFISVLHSGAIWNFGAANDFYGVDIYTSAYAPIHDSDHAGSESPSLSLTSTVPSTSDDVEQILAATIGLLETAVDLPTEHLEERVARETIDPQHEAECTSCDERKPIHRRLTLTDADGTVLDIGHYCMQCWTDQFGNGSRGLRDDLNTDFYLTDGENT